MVFFNLRGSVLSVAQIGLIVAPCFILFGYNQAGIGGLLSLPDWTNTFPEIDTIHTTGARKSQNAVFQGLVVASFVIGAITACMACMFLGDILGRRKSIFIGGLLSLAGEVICSTSNTLGQFVSGRTIIGAAIGIFSSTVPVWQAECSPPEHRGKHVVLDGLFTTLGYALTSWANYGSSRIHMTDQSISWRLPLALPNLFSIIVLLFIFFLPESPRWLIKVGRYQEATEIMSKLKDLPIDSSEIINEVNEMRSALDESVTQKATLKDMFTMGPDKLFFRFCLCILLQFYQQMSGANLISVYGTVIFEQSLDIQSQKAKLLTGGALTWKFFSSFLAFFTIDRFGRRALFMFSGSGMGICMFILSITTAFEKDDSNLAAAYISVISIFLYNFFVPIGFLGANFLYCVEVAPVSLRVGMSAISTANHWLWNFIVIMVTPIAIDRIGHWYFDIYAAIALSIPIVVWLEFPETMGLSLEEIEMLFRNSSKIRTVVKKSLQFKRKGDGFEDNVKDSNENTVDKQLNCE
ncbi:putative glycerol proton symporter [Erysiphe necator]|uniref:Putative glycerol proton symporter n=1 Tax=Uncinula necator TaxID=52586 RepID=A0A0B1PHV4_UNCNE|nr:putative glycerol proton symporter [Erysiphe necator]